jgi:hypothetical protein
MNIAWEAPEPGNFNLIMYHETGDDENDAQDDQPFSHGAKVGKKLALKQTRIELVTSGHGFT